MILSFNMTRIHLSIVSLDLALWGHSCSQHKLSTRKTLETYIKGGS